MHREFARSITESCIQAKVKILQTDIGPGALANFGIGTLAQKGMEAAEMKKLIIVALIPALALTVMQSTASAAPGSASGASGFALAAVIAQHSPAVRAFVVVL